MADEETRVQRLTSQREMSEGESRSRIASQVQDSKRVKIADLVIENNGTLEELRRSVGDVWSEIERRSRALYS
jgi:dephospho-CoA kinase